MPKSAVDEVTNAYKTFNKAIDRVLVNPPGPARWRACVDMWLTLSPRNKLDYKTLVRENAQARQLVDKHGQAIGATKAEKADKTLRQALSIPAGLYYLIERADPMAFREKKNARLMFKELKEFTTREVY